jgi:lipoyl(octanoyl) transferase
MSDGQWVTAKEEAPFLITHHPSLIIRKLGLVEYLPTWQAMRDFTARRDADTPDEIWLLEHPPVYTQGLAGRPEHLLRATEIPLVATDRGGQITYHGPGQIVMYLLFDMQRRGIGVKALVQEMEQAVIDLLAEYGVAGTRREKAPGVYVGEAKIAALGLKVKSGGSYHGLALNVDMDLAPFAAINPCGYEGMRVTQTSDEGIVEDIEALGGKLVQRLQGNLDRRSK